MKTMNNFIISAVASIVLAGTEAKADFMQCIPCPAGSKCDGINKSPCEAGTFSTGGASSCSQCSAGTFSTGGASSCTPCGELEWSNAGASRCSGLEYVITDTIAEVGGGQQKSGTLSPGFYLIILGAGDGGRSFHARYSDDYGNPDKTGLLNGKGAKLKRIIKVTSNTSYVIGGGADGEDAYYYTEVGDDNCNPKECANNPTGGGGGSWATIGGTNYVAGGGGGAGQDPYYEERNNEDDYIYIFGVVGGNGGAIGWGGDSYTSGGESGTLRYNEGSPGSKGVGASTACNVQPSNNVYGGAGGWMSEIDCDPSGSSIICQSEWCDSGATDGSCWYTVFQTKEQCNNSGLFYKKGGDGKVSHSDNTGGRFGDKLCKNCARLYKIK